MRCGFDIGGTKIFGVVIDEDPEDPVATSRTATRADADVIIERLVVMTGELENEAGPIDAVGVGIAGIVDRDGTLRYSPNVPGVLDFEVGPRLSAELGVPVAVENDATAAVWAETKVGAARGCDHVALVTLGTGIGTGFVSDGALHRGWNGFAGESGHMIIDMDGPEHITGARGPWEYFASGSGLGRLARRAGAAGELQGAVAAAGSVEAIRGEHLAPAIEREVPGALAILDEFSRYVSIGVANLIHILDPEMIVFGGGLVDLGQPLIDRVRQWTDELVLGGVHRPRPRIVPAQLGPRAGALGAAMVAGEKVS